MCMHTQGLQVQQSWPLASHGGMLRTVELNVLQFCQQEAFQGVPASMLLYRAKLPTKASCRQLCTMHAFNICPGITGLQQQRQQQQHCFLHQGVGILTVHTSSFCYMLPTRPNTLFKHEQSQQLLSHTTVSQQSCKAKFWCTSACLSKAPSCQTFAHTIYWNNFFNP